MSWAMVETMQHDEDICYGTERAKFMTEHGATPEEWLRRWRDGEIADTLTNNLALHDASLLEEP